jgi:hypothetical protein
MGYNDEFQVSTWDFPGKEKGKVMKKMTTLLGGNI